ncbi:MAG: stage V sporulation protein E [Clostridiaceae bacterium]|nr:stage V sporulation protein E [Clostridiaceae bacterium]
MVKANKKRRKLGNIDYGLFYTVLVLLAIGIVMIYSASSYYAMLNYKDSTYFLKKQLISCVIGLGAMVFFIMFDYHKLKKFTLPLMIIAAPLLLAVYAFEPTNGAYRWIKLGPLSFQPSELAKYVVVLFLAYGLSNKGDRVKDFWTGIVPFLCVSGFYAGLVLLQKNLSIATIIMIVTFVLLFTAGGRLKHLFGYIAPLLVAAATFFTLSSGYRRARLLNFIDPWQDAAKNGYQLIQSFYALGAGGVLGLGLGQSRQKTLYMPEPHNDFIFSIIGEELGLVGCLVIIALFIVLICRGVKTALEAKDTYGTLLAMGITSIIGFQTIINIAVVTGSMPVTGVPLPFISYGGTSLAFTTAAIGILLNISRQKEINRN